MSNVWADRVAETSTTTGTGAFTLSGAVDRYRTFGSVMSTSDTCYYAIEGAASTGEWETGLGTYSGANTLTRTTVLASSNGGAAVNFSAGTKVVVLTQTAANTTPGLAADVLTGTDAVKPLTADALAALWEQGSDVASAGTISLGEGGYFNITGTTTITDIDFATDKAGRHAWVKFAGALTLTHNASTLILPGGANITTVAGDTACFISEGSDVVRCVVYSRAGLQVFPVGADITPAAAPGVSAVGYLGAPQNIQNGAYTTTMSDAGKHLYHTSGSAHTWTIDSNANVAYPIGTILTFINESGGGAVTLAITSDTLRWGSSTGSRTLAANGTAAAIKVASTTWRLTGDGLS